MRAVVITVGVVGLIAGGLAVPAQAATKPQMREALLSQAEVRALVPDTSGLLSGREVTSTTAYYTTWEAFGDQPMSVTSLSITSRNQGRARPRDVFTPFSSDFTRIRRTDDKLVQSREEFAGEAVRVVIFRGRNAVSAVCAQVSSGSEEPPVPRKQLRACANTVAKAQFDQLLRVVG